MCLEQILQSISSYSPHFSEDILLELKLSVNHFPTPWHKVVPHKLQQIKAEKTKVFRPYFPNQDMLWWHQPSTIMLLVV